MPTGVYERTEETKDKMRLSKLGENNPMHGKHLSEVTKEKLSKIHLKNPTKYWLGKKHSKETIEKMRIAHLRENLSDETLEKLKLSHSGMKGKYHTKETKKKMRFAQLRGKHWNWQGGISFEPYAPEFNRQLKELIRQRDGYKCQLCGMPECENIVKLSIHHIDYNKRNCLPLNLISLCNKCNAKVNFNRLNWGKYFKEIRRKYDQKE